MRNAHTTSGIKYGLAEYEEALVVIAPSPYDESATTRFLYPFSGGCWMLDDDGCKGRQLEGTGDVRAPRSPSRWRAFVRREHIA